MRMVWGVRVMTYPVLPVPSSSGDQSVSMKQAPPRSPPTTLVYRLMLGVRRKRLCMGGH